MGGGHGVVGKEDTKERILKIIVNVLLLLMFYCYDVSFAVLCLLTNMFYVLSLGHIGN